MSETPPPSGDAPEAPSAKTRSVVSVRPRGSFWRRLGGEGLTVSLAIHALLVLLAAAWVVSEITTQAKKDPNTFATGAGGGSGGERVNNQPRKVQPKNVKNMAKTTARITSKSSTSSISLPDLPPAASMSSMISGMMGGGSSKGFGGGSGGGIGAGRGMGVGGGKNFVAKPMMGAQVFAQSIAVYFDSSDSLIDYLDAVQSEIKKSFPDADVFIYEQPAITIQDGDVVGGKDFMKGKVRTARGVNTNTKRPDGKTLKPVTEQKTLSGKGRTLLTRYDQHFKTGRLGAWLDIMREEKTYDALVVFTDFADYGLTQIRVKGVKAEKGFAPTPLVLFSDDANYGVGRGVDNRKPQEKEWEQDWIKSFSPQANGPKLYIFTTRNNPGAFMTSLATASGGAVTKINPADLGKGDSKAPGVTQGAGAVKPVR
ncbi:MAG: hypothetical protein ACKO4N_00265 [Verrucomicrobiota bacterium]